MTEQEEQRMREQTTVVVPEGKRWRAGKPGEFVGVPAGTVVGDQLRQ